MPRRERTRCDVEKDDFVHESFAKGRKDCIEVSREGMCRFNEGPAVISLGRFHREASLCGSAA